MIPNRIDGVLVEWGDRLFYGSNRIVRSRTPLLLDHDLRRVTDHDRLNPMA